MNALVRIIVALVSLGAGIGSILAAIRGEFGFAFNLGLVGVLAGIIVFVERP